MRAELCTSCRRKQQFAAAAAAACVQGSKGKGHNVRADTAVIGRAAAVTSS